MFSRRPPEPSDSDDNKDNTTSSALEEAERAKLEQQQEIKKLNYLAEQIKAASFREQQIDEKVLTK